MPNQKQQKQRVGQINPQVKPAVQSSELRVIFLTLFSSALVHLLEEGQFIDLVGDKLYIFTTMSLVLVGLLRVYKTDKAIEGFFKDKPKTDPIAEAFAEDAEDQGLV